MKKLFAFLALLVAWLSAPQLAHAYQSWDFTNNSNPKAVYFGANQVSYNGTDYNGWGSWLPDTEMTWDSNNKFWYIIVTLKNGGFNFYFKAKGTDNVTRSYGKNGNISISNGSATLDYAITKDDAYNSGNNYCSGLTSGRQYIIKIKAMDTGSNKDQAKCIIEEYYPTLYVYEKNGGSWNNKVASASNSNNTSVVFDNVDLTTNQEIILKTAQSNGWIDQINYKDGNDKTFCSGSETSNTSNFQMFRGTGVWKVGSDGKYKITVTYNSAREGTVKFEKLTAVTTTVYLMGIGGDWATGIPAEANASNQATFTVNNWASGTEFKFKIGSTWYGKGDGDIVNGSWYDNVSTAVNAANFTLPSSATGKKVTFTVASDNGHFTASWEERKAHMPLSKEDFFEADGTTPKPHYFLVGPRQGGWRLQPEWELHKMSDGKYYISNDEGAHKAGRFIYPGLLAVAKVDNYADYIQHKYTLWGAKYWILGTTNPAAITLNKKVTNFQAITNWDNVPMYRAGDDGYGNDLLNDNHAAILFMYGSSGIDSNLIKDGAGTFVESICLTVNENDSQLGTIKFDVDVATRDGVAQRIFQICGSDQYHNQYNNTSADGIKTPMAAKLDNMLGWQEGFIQFDSKGNPYYDANGNYLYQTAYDDGWFEGHKTNFRVQDPSGASTMYTSDKITFVESSALEDLDSDPYREFYKSLSGNRTIATSTTANTGGSAEDGTAYSFKPSVNEGGSINKTNWKCYVVKDTWLSGQFKIWTGGGGNNVLSEGFGGDAGAKTTSRWNGPNGGPNGSKGDRVTVSGVDVTDTSTPQTSVLYRNHKNIDDVNYQVTGQQYFNRIILWYDVTGGINESFVQFIQETASPRPKAYTGTVANVSGFNTHGASLKEGEGLSADNQLFYLFDLFDLSTQTGATEIASYTVKRYRVTPDGTELSGTVETVNFASGSRPTLSNFGTKAGFDAGNGNKGISAGTYLYEVTVTFADGKTKTARSNEVTLYDPNNAYTPDPLPVQLIEISDAAVDHLCSKTLATAIKAKRTKTYLTYKTSKDGKYFLVNPNSDDPTAAGYAIAIYDVDDTKAKYVIDHPWNPGNDLNNPQAESEANGFQSYWTSGYYLRALVDKDYQKHMNSLRAQGMILQDANPVPSLTVKDNSTNQTLNCVKSRVHVGNDADGSPTGDEYYGVIMRRGGTLAPGNFDFSLSYEVDHNTRGTADNVEVTPVLPKPRLFKYLYHNDIESGATVADDFTIETRSMVKENTPLTLSVSKDGYVKRRLNCDFSFYRPNVCNEILRNYDIRYDVKVSSNDPEVGTILTQKYNDTSVEREQGPRAYSFMATDVNPNLDYYPTLEVVETSYHPNKSELGSTVIKGTYAFGATKIPAQNKPHVTAPTFGNEDNTAAGGQQIMLASYNNVPTGGTGYDWYLYRLALTKVADDVDSQVAASASGVLPSFFQIETYNGDEDTTNPSDWGYCNQLVKLEGETHVINDTPTNYYTWQAFGHIMQVRAYGYKIGQSFTSMTGDQPTKPWVVVTPVYLYYHDPAPRVDTTSPYFNPYPAPPAAPAMAPAKAEANPADSHTVLMGEKAKIDVSKEDNGATTGVEEVGVDHYVPEYYTLQGVRVTEPVPGQMYLIRRGNRVTKEFVR